MIISRTPFRISFFGGGTDYPAWYNQEPGMVLSTTIDKYCYLTCRKLPPFFDYTTRLVYSKTELVNQIDEIQHPAVRETLRYMKHEGGIELPSCRRSPGSKRFGSFLLIRCRAPAHPACTPGTDSGQHGPGPRTAIHVERDCIQEAVGSQGSNRHFVRRIQPHPLLR